MSFFDFFRGKKAKKKVAVEEDAARNEIEAGLEEAIQKKQTELQTLQDGEEIVLTEYEPNLSFEESESEIEQSVVLERTTEECLLILQENCEQIVESRRQNENAKIEYQAVTEYLSDVQKIERMELGEKELLKDAARRVITLTKEREVYQSREVHTTDSCFRAIRNYDGSLMEELKKMRQSEEYNQLLKNDMRQLEAEKAALKYENHDLYGKQAELKKIAVATAAIVISLFALFYVLGEGLERSMAVPYLLTVAMAAVVAAYVFWEAYRNRYDHMLNGKKINRAIELLNKVKVKYINNTSALEYNCSKLGVQNSMELEYLIKEYTKAKEQERAYQSNTDRLSHYRQKVLDILRVHQIKDVEIWLYQVSALVKADEFEAVKTNLEDRRKRLTERMDYNLQVKDNCFNNMHQILEEKPELKEDLLEMLEKYHIRV